MKISHKLSMNFVVIITTITLFSIFITSSVQKKLKEVETFHNTGLDLVQNNVMKIAEAVEEDFAYIASDAKGEKEAFLTWSEKRDLATKETRLLAKKNLQNNEEKEELFEAILSGRTDLFKKAREVFNEYEVQYFLSNKLLNEYENIVDELLSNYKKIEEVELEQAKMVELVEETVKNIILVGFITICSSIFSIYFIAKSISKPIKSLKLATIEVANGNLNTLIELKSKGEIGDLAISFSRMTENLKKYREELITAKNYTNNILKSMSDALIVISTEGNIITVNNASCAMLKYEEDELIGQPFKNIYVKEELPFNEAQFDNLIQNACDSYFEATYLAKDGSKIPVSFSSSLLLDDNEEIQGIVCVAQDITERKQAEVEIKNALEKEKQLGELKSRFVTMASHEFRTPLATILSSTELLEHYSHKWSEEKKLNHFQRIQASVKYMTGLLNDVLLIGKAEAGKLEFKPTRLNLAKLCQHITEEVQAVAGTNHIIAFSSVGQSNDVLMDEKLLQHILTNLLTNAVKYSPQGGTVLFNLICDREVAVFSIQDRGIGIPLEDQEKLFESFHRATNVSTIPGTGLGLAIVKKSVDLHGGKITVKSAVGVGTTFTVTLPLSKQV
jgi:PAS domain S-box-containing protein